VYSTEAKFLAYVPTTQAFGRSFDVADNATGAQAVFGGATGVGTFSANCSDQSQKPGVEDPITVLNFANQSGETINLTQRRGTDAPVIQAPRERHRGGPDHRGLEHVRVPDPEGDDQLVVRQDGRGQAAAFCLVYGTILRVDG